jgi:hypothetical protein
VLTCATPAFGGEISPPWSGGGAHAGRFERTATRIASSLAGDAVSVECTAPDRWRALAAREGFDAGTTWAMTPLHLLPGESVARPDGRSDLSPRACTLASAFSAAPSTLGARLCRHGTTTRWRTVAAAQRGSRPVRRRVRVPILGECDDWGPKLVAVHVLGHESMHLAGVTDEGVADCLAVQLDAYVAVQLGASDRFARSLAAEYWRSYYPAQDARYRSRGCRDDGPLDLFRDRAGWPTPTRYPAAPGTLVASFVARAAAAHEPTARVQQVESAHSIG